MALFRFRNRIDVSDSASFSGPGYNVMYLQSAAPNDAALIDQANAIQAFYTACAGIYTNGTIITVAESIVESPDTDKILRPVGQDTVAGTSTNSPLPPQLAVCVSWRTNVAARWGRGRTFLGPLQTAVSDTVGTVLGSTLTVIRTAAADLITDLAALTPTCTLAVHHVIRGGVERPPNDFTAVVSSSVDARIDTQRRRA